MVKTIRYGSKIKHLTVTKDASMVVTGSMGGEIVMWRIADSTRIHTITDAHYRRVYGLHFTQNEQYILSASSDGTVKMWRTQDAKCVAKLKGGEPYWFAVLNKDNSRYFTGSKEGTIKIWCNSQRHTTLSFFAHDYKIFIV